MKNISKEIEKIFHNLSQKPIGNNFNDIYGYCGDIHDIGTIKKEKAWEVKKGWLIDHGYIDSKIDYLQKYLEEKNNFNFTLNDCLSDINCWFCENIITNIDKNFCTNCQSYKCSCCGRCECL